MKQLEPMSAPLTPRFDAGRRFKLPVLFFPALGLVLICALMTALNGDFLTLSNFENVTRQISINAIIAAGMTCVILSGGIDLSVGAVAALAGTLTAGMIVAQVSPLVAVLGGLGVGILFGLVNGALVAYLRMPPIIVTLATMGIARGIVQLYTGGYPIDGLPDWFSFFGRGTLSVPDWFGLSGHPGSGSLASGHPALLTFQMPILIMFGVFAIIHVLLTKTIPGRYIFAIGGNEQATRLSGIRVERYKLMVYGICGLTSAIAGLVLSSRVMSGQSSAGVGFELDAIAVVVMGGTAITGGRGAVLGTLIGAFMLGVLNNGLNLMGQLPHVQMGQLPYLQNVLKGVIILGAIYLGRERARRS